MFYKILTNHFFLFTELLDAKMSRIYLQIYTSAVLDFACIFSCSLSYILLLSLYRDFHKPFTLFAQHFPCAFESLIIHLRLFSILSK